MTGRLVMRAGRRHQVVAQPDTSSLGACSLDVLAALLEARKLGASVGFLRPAATWPAALAQLVTDVPKHSLDGPAGLWCRVRWGQASLMRRAAAWRRDRMLSIRRELARELRRYAGDERFPAGVRTRLKDAARVIGHPAPAASTAARPRQLIRERLQASLDRDARTRASAEAKAAGIPIDRPLVAFELPHRVESALPAVRFLLEQGYGVVRIGDPRGGGIEMAGLIDLACGPQPSALLEFFVLQSARFVVAESVDVEHAAYLTGTPTLTLNARDPISRYPIRRDGVFTLTRAVDLDSGRVIPLAERLEGAYFQNERNIGHMPNEPGIIVDAVREMHEGASGAWHDSPEQVAFRTAATAAASVLPRSVPQAAEWAADGGFLGDGRLTRAQAADAGGVG
jgi:putative glycosyltransferase (TIGR04372 family)